MVDVPFEVVAAAVAAGASVVPVAAPAQLAYTDIDLPPLVGAAGPALVAGTGLWVAGTRRAVRD